MGRAGRCLAPVRLEKLSPRQSTHGLGSLRRAVCPVLRNRARRVTELCWVHFPRSLGGSGTKTAGSVPGGPREGAGLPACWAEPRLGHVPLAPQVPAGGQGDRGSSPQLRGTSPAGNDLPLPAQGGGQGRAPSPRKALRGLGEAAGGCAGIFGLKMGLFRDVSGAQNCSGFLPAAWLRCPAPPGAGSWLTACARFSG